MEYLNLEEVEVKVEVKILTAAERCYENHKRGVKAYYLKNKDKYKQYYLDNKEKYNYKEKLPHKVAKTKEQRNREYYQRKKEKQAASII